MLSLRKILQWGKLKKRPAKYYYYIQYRVNIVRACLTKSNMYYFSVTKVKGQGRYLMSRVLKILLFIQRIFLTQFRMQGAVRPIDFFKLVSKFPGNNVTKSITCNTLFVTFKNQSIQNMLFAKGEQDFVQVTKINAIGNVARLIKHQTKGYIRVV